MGAKWKKEEREYLLKNYACVRNADLMRYLGRSESSIESQAGKQGLKKEFNYRTYKTAAIARKTKAPKPIYEIDNIVALQNVEYTSSHLSDALQQCRKIPDFILIWLDKLRQDLEIAQLTRKQQCGQ